MNIDYMGKNSLAHLVGKIYSVFAQIGHSHSKSDIRDFPEIPTKTSDLVNDSGFKTTDNNTTYTLTKDGETIVLTGSDGSAMSVEDSDTKITVDSELSSSSTNPVQNKVIDTALQALTDSKVDTDVFSNHTDNTSNPHSVTAEQTGALPISGGAITGTIDASATDKIIDFGTSGWFRGSTTSGGRFDIFGYSSPTSLQVGGAYPELVLKGKNARPTYNYGDMALYSDIDNIQSQLNKKADDFSIEIYNGTSGNPKPVRFASFNYSTCSSENGIAAKISLVSGHGNGSSYAFLEDAIIRVSYSGSIEVDNFRYYGASTDTYDGINRQYGDIFWLIDTTNKIVDFYCLMGQYARLYQTPWKRLTYSSGGTVTQHTNCTVYSSGTKAWANNSDIALYTDVSSLSTEISSKLNRYTAVNAADANYTTLMARGTSLNSVETTPTVNGAIAWTYK